MWTSETPKSSRQLQENFLKASTLREQNRSKNGYGKCAAASRRRQEPCNSVKIRTNWFFAIFLKVTPVDDASKAITEEQHVSCELGTAKSRARVYQYGKISEEAR